MLGSHNTRHQSVKVMCSVLLHSLAVPKRQQGWAIIGSYNPFPHEIDLTAVFLNWCNVNPDKITKWDQLWFRGFVSIILNPFLRVFAISVFLKVIHAPKTSHFRYPKNNLPTYIFSNICNWDFP